MKKLIKRTVIAINILCLLTFGLMLTSCGGGGSQGVSSEVVNGVAAVGAPLAGQVKLKDSANPDREKTTVIGSDGSFAIDVSDMKGPFILQAVGSVNGKNHTMYSFAEKLGTANVNPLSSAALAIAAEVDDPAEVYEHPDPATIEKIKTRLPEAVAELMEELKPLLLLYSADKTDPITGDCRANHEGLDGVFDNVTITLSNGILTVVNTATGAVIFTGNLSDIKGGQFTDNDDDLPKPPSFPAAPAGVTATGEAGQVIVTWDAVSNATSYNIYWSTTSGVTTASGTNKITGAASPYVHTGLAAETVYYYIVTAVNSAGEGASSAQVSATTGSTPPPAAVPTAPTGVIATGGTNQVTVSWSAVSGAASYNLYWSTSSGVTTSGTQISGVTSPAVHTGLTDSTPYYYIVTAVNSAGESMPSVEVAATTLAPSPSPTVPASPAGVTATGGANQVTVSWSAVSGAASYNLYWSTSSGVTTSGTQISGVTSPAVHTGLTDSTPYYYIVTAVNSAGESAASAEATATTNAAPPPPPPALDGAALYETNCQRCHAALASTDIVGRTLQSIKNAGMTRGLADDVLLAILSVLP